VVGVRDGTHLHLPLHLEEQAPQITLAATSDDSRQHHHSTIPAAAGIGSHSCRRPSRDRGLRHQIAITSQASGLSKRPSFTRLEDTRAVAYERLDRRIGAVTPAELAAVRRILRAFLDL